MTEPCRAESLPVAHRAFHDRISAFKIGRAHV